MKKRRKERSKEGIYRGRDEVRRGAKDRKAGRV